MATTITTLFERPVSDGRIARVELHANDHQPWLAGSAHAVAFVGDERISKAIDSVDTLRTPITTASGTVYTHNLGKLAMTTDEAALISTAKAAHQAMHRDHLRQLGRDFDGTYRFAADGTEWAVSTKAVAKWDWDDASSETIVTSADGRRYQYYQGSVFADANGERTWLDKDTDLYRAILHGARMFYASQEGAKLIAEDVRKANPPAPRPERIIPPHIIDLFRIYGSAEKAWEAEDEESWSKMLPFDVPDMGDAGLPLDLG